MLYPLQGQSQVNIADALIQFDGGDPAGYDREIIASTKIDPMSSGRPWTFQYCTEYGWFQSMSTEHPMRSPAVDEKYFSDMCADVFDGLDMSNFPKADQTTVDQGGFDTAGTNIFFANGGEDPW